MKKYLLISIIIHSLLLFLSLSHSGNTSGGKRKGKGSGDSENKGSQYNGVKVGSIIPKDRPTEVTIVEVDHHGIKKKRKHIRKSFKECPGPWYGGIGIRSELTPKGEEIVEVFPGYPADLAGIMIGDTIVEVKDNVIIGPPGTIVHITTSRGAYAITRGKICF